MNWKKTRTKKETSWLIEKPEAGLTQFSLSGTMPVQGIVNGLENRINFKLTH